MIMKSGKRLAGIVLAVMMVVAMLPWVGINARAAADSSVTLKIPEKVYDGYRSEIEMSDLSSVGYSIIRQNRGNITGTIQNYIEVDLANIQIEEKNSVFRIDDISGSDGDIAIYNGFVEDNLSGASDRASSDDNENYSDLEMSSNFDTNSYNSVQTGKYVYSNSKGKILIGDIYILKPGSYNIVLTDLTSSDHEKITLTIDARESDNGSDISFDSAISVISADYNYSGSEVGSKISSDSNEQVKCVNGVYYLNYNNGSNIYLLSFPLNRDYIYYYDWTGGAVTVHRIKLESGNTGIRWSEDAFSIEKKISQYTFNDSEVELTGNEYESNFNPSDGFHTSILNGAMFQLSAPISGTAEIPVTFYNDQDEKVTSSILISTDPAPSAGDDSKTDTGIGSTYSFKMNEDSIVNFTVRPEDSDYNGSWSAVFSDGSNSYDIYSGVEGERNDYVILPSGDYSIQITGEKDSDKFTFDYDTDVLDLGTPSINKVSVGRAGNKAKFNTISLNNTNKNTVGYRVKISKKKGMSSPIYNKVVNTYNATLKLNTTKSVSGKSVYVTVQPYTENFYGTKVWGKTSSVKTVTLPKKPKAPKGYYVYTDSKYGYTVFVPKWMKKKQKVSGGYTFKGKGITMKLYGKNTSYSSASSYANAYYGSDVTVSGSTFSYYENMNDTLMYDYGYWVKGKSKSAIICEVVIPPSKNYRNWTKVQKTVRNSIKKNSSSNTLF